MKIANYLCPGNYAVSGSKEGCDAVERLGKSYKARQVKDVGRVAMCVRTCVCVCMCTHVLACIGTNASIGLHCWSLSMEERATLVLLPWVALQDDGAPGCGGCIPHRVHAAGSGEAASRPCTDRSQVSGSRRWHASRGCSMGIQDSLALPCIVHEPVHCFVRVLCAVCGLHSFLLQCECPIRTMSLSASAHTSCQQEASDPCHLQRGCPAPLRS